MSFQSPISKCTAFIPGLGTVEGFQFANGVQQFCGIPYAHLPKRWSRSVLRTLWDNGHHDGTKLGNDCPSPMIEGDDADTLVPVPPAAHFPASQIVDELSGLVMNIVIPHAARQDNKPLPVLVYVHGGSLLYGGANLPIFDAVNLVSHSITIGIPIICINFNYRVGIGGFLAGKVIARELEQDGYAGSGNFGFTDQHVAFDWVQRYIGSLGGDIQNVTAVGESAGGISISNQLLAATPPIFHRAVCMSGLSSAIPAFTMEQHDRFFEDVCRYFHIDPACQDALDKLRAIPQQEIANATPAIQGVPSGTGNPCLDGWFYRSGVDPRRIHAPPSWLKGYMIGDTYHEGVIFHINLLEESYASIQHVMKTHIKDGMYADEILSAYGINEDLAHDTLLERVEHMCGDAIFKIPNYVMAQECMRQRVVEDILFLYHFDQRSRIKNGFEGTAYHAYELLYLFGNLANEMNDGEKTMTREFASAWIRFVNGVEPWARERWMVWGPGNRMGIKSEAEDEDVREYTRMERVLQLGSGEAWMQWVAAVDALVNGRKF
ncbi:hypothetical protein PENANT_c013G09538 [Penicillium antarcticum]|uniref:Carboxylesterase type B domain-containing protein n=1 Tax=Penicillium antarcticum TaxID=416450 RepID=A0A1V6Q5C2_9EURO|nr:uncharacterized protein N7508_004301 [Penicillium antarcticum]KAJ5308922.1 hypothetical protein N7508_004301 [Penicillium antarcticum]OQD84441.1 hypothetical protein PENANT_c013G09538 [Penicillium antarcticum]